MPEDYNMFDFNIWEGFNWSPFEKYMSDPNNMQNDLAKLDAGLAAASKFPEFTDPSFYEAWYMQDPEALAKDAEIAAAIKAAQNTVSSQTSATSVTSTTSATSTTTTTTTTTKTTIKTNNDYTYTPPIVVNPTPISPIPIVPVSPPPPPVKTAPIDTILYEEDPIPVEIMADLIFENIGGQELINISRNDLINGQKVIYQPIKNLNSIEQEYNSNNIIALQNVSPQIFNNFPIKLDTKVPTMGSGPDGAFIYIDPTNGDLVIEAINLENGEQIEVQIVQGGTIYEEEL